MKIKNNVENPVLFNVGLLVVSVVLQRRWRPGMAIKNTQIVFANIV